MESLGKAGHVQMTDATFAHLSAPLQRLFAARNVNVKGKGPMVTHMAQARGQGHDVMCPGAVPLTQAPL